MKACHVQFCMSYFLSFLMMFSVSVYRYCGVSWITPPAFLFLP